MSPTEIFERTPVCIISSKKTKIDNKNKQNQLKIRLVPQRHATCYEEVGSNMLASYGSVSQWRVVCADSRGEWHAILLGVVFSKAEGGVYEACRGDVATKSHCLTV